MPQPSKMACALYKLSSPGVKASVRTPLISTQVFAPEAQGKLAGGGAKRNQTEERSRPGRDA